MLHRNTSAPTSHPPFNIIEEDRISVYPAEKGIVFLSDVHLGSFSPAREQELETAIIQLLNYCETVGYRIVILGDLFDYWMEYPDWHPPLGQRILSAFRAYHERQEPTLYITGNHDHWYLDHLPSFGFNLEDEYQILRVGQQQFFLLHGDGLADPRWNLARSKFNRMLRSPLFIRIFRSVFPPDFGLTLMKFLSELNKRFESEEKNQQNSRLVDWASRMLNDNRIHAVICGHNHNSQIETLKGGTFMNPGAFGTNKTLGIYTKGQFQLVQWDTEKQKLRNILY